MPITVFPAIFEFLGYDPFPEPEIVQDQLMAKRRIMGGTIQDAATAIGVDPGTWGDWERGKTVLYRQHRAIVAQLCGVPDEVMNLEMGLRFFSCPFCIDR